MRFLLRFWLEVLVAVLAVALWPLAVIVRRARRERWSDPR